jgi:hypothetical protein
MSHCETTSRFQDLIRDTDEKRDEWKTLTAALHKLSTIVDYVNEMQKTAQSAQARMIQRLVEIENSIETEKVCSGLQFSLFFFFFQIALIL